MDILFLLFGFVLIILVSIFMEKSFEVLNIDIKWDKLVYVVWVVGIFSTVFFVFWLRTLID